MLSTLQTIDENILLWIQNYLRQEFLNPPVELFNIMGNGGLIWIILSLAMVCWKPTRKAGLLAGLALVFSLFFTNLGLKPFFARPRPYVVMEGIIPLLTSMDPNSFPSGHTSAAFAACMVWARTLPNRWMRIVSVVMAVCMGLSRLYVGVHYPSDVLAGALIGSICAILSLGIAYFIQGRKKEQSIAP